MAGSTSADTERNASGSISRTISAARSSWAGLAKEFMKQMATAFTSSLLRNSTSRRTESSSKGVMTAPA